MTSEEIEEFLINSEGDTQVQSFIKAIRENDLATFKRLVDAEDADIHLENDMLMYYLFHVDRWEMFSYIVDSPQFYCNFLDNLHRTLLMNFAFIPDKEKYAQVLIEKGTDVNCSDRTDLTYLHLAASNSKIDHTELVKIVIENGADINAQEEWGKTPLYIACEGNNDYLVNLFLYYGADPTILDWRGVLPIVKTSSNHLHEILFYYSFDEKVMVHLLTLAEVMQLDNDLFTRIVERTEDILYDEYDLRKFVWFLREMKPRHLKLFLEKFSDMLTVLNDASPLLVTVFDSCPKAVVNVFVQSNRFAELLQTLSPPYSAISNLIENFGQEEENVEIICLMLSHGLDVTSSDLDTVYHHYGHSELFRVLLHMDIIMLEEEESLSVARLYYDVRCDIDAFSKNLSTTAEILNYYNHPKLKEACLAAENQAVVAKASALPDVPSLIELSRNAARKLIAGISKNSRQFYTIVDRLPITEFAKEILILRRKLY